MISSPGQLGVPFCYSFRLAGRQAQARQEKLAVLGVSQEAYIWDHLLGKGS